jgi:LPXTG-motif cell wall-anchored protein
VIEVVSGGSEHPQSSPQPSEASASQKAAGGEAKVLAETGGTNPAVYAGLGFIGLVVSALLARRLLG